MIVSSDVQFQFEPSTHTVQSFALDLIRHMHQTWTKATDFQFLNQRDSPIEVLGKTTPMNAERTFFGPLVCNAAAAPKCVANP